MKCSLMHPNWVRVEQSAVRQRKIEARRSRPRRARRDTVRGAFGSEASGGIGLIWMRTANRGPRIARKGTFDLGAKDFTVKAPYGSVTAQRDEDAKPRRSSACSSNRPPKNFLVFFFLGKKIKKNGFGLSVGVKTERKTCRKKFEKSGQFFEGAARRIHRWGSSECLKKWTNGPQCSASAWNRRR
jgi:hypothetical protein